MLNEIEKIRRDIFKVARKDTWDQTTRQLAHDAGYQYTQEVAVAILTLSLEGRLILKKNDKGETLVKRVTKDDLEELLTEE